MNRNRIFSTVLVALAALPTLAQDAVIVQQGDTTQVTTTTSSAKQTTVMTGNNGQRIIVTINEKPVAFEAAQPVMISGRVMVPLRGVTEQLGGNILYDAPTKAITGAHPTTGNQFRLRVGSGEALLNGQNMTLDSPPRVVNGTTYVPLRFVSEAFGAQVAWDGARRTVVIGVDGNKAEVKTPQTAVITP